jgi:hypothetical protein
MRNERRRILMVLVMTAVGAAGAVALVGGHGSRDHGSRLAPPSHLGHWVQERAATRIRWLRSSKARAERARSRRAYAGLDRPQIASVVRKEFPATVNSVKSMVQPRDVRRYTSDYTAIVDSGPGAKAAGGTALAVSSVPLRTGHRRPVDLSLHSRPGGLGPANALADFTLPSNLRDAIQLPARVPLMVASGHAAGVAATRIGSSSALYANVDTDTDVLASASPRGLELFRLVRSPRAPSREDLRLQLPRGASLRQVRGSGVEVVRDGQPVVSIDPPRAVDAQGRRVPVSMDVRGNSLRITLGRGTGDWAYPILVDPAIDGYAWADFPGWYGYNTGNYSLYGDCMFGRECFGPGLNQYQGLNVYAWQNQFYTGSSNAGFGYRTPSNPGVFIARATLGWVAFWNGESTPTPYMYAELWDTGYNARNAAQALYQSYWFGTFDLVRIGQSSGVREVHVGLQENAGVDRKALADHHAYVGTTTIYLDDTGIPGFGNIGRPPWVDQRPAPIPLTVSDAGLGIASITVSAPGGSTWQTPVGCAGGNRNPCPGTWSSPANGSPTYDPSGLPQGQNDLTVTATDAAGHVSDPATTHVPVDHTDPTLDLSGSLATLSQSQSGGN